MSGGVKNAVREFFEKLDTQYPTVRVDRRLVGAHYMGDAPDGTQLFYVGVCYYDDEGVLDDDEVDTYGVDGIRGREEALAVMQRIAEECLAGQQDPKKKEVS